MKFRGGYAVFPADLLCQVHFIQLDEEPADLQDTEIGGGEVVKPDRADTIDTFGLDTLLNRAFPARLAVDRLVIVACQKILGQSFFIASLARGWASISMKTLASMVFSPTNIENSRQLFISKSRFSALNGIGVPSG